MKFCVSIGVGTWTTWLTFEPDPDYSPDAGTGLLSPISYALQRGILLHRENPTYTYWAPVAEARRGFKMVLFTASRGNTFVGGTCALPSALLVNFHSALASAWVRKCDLNSAAFTIRYDSVYLTCSKKLTGSQLSPSHGTNKKLKCEIKFWN